jgi:glycosyltransferase involved in cell wall biosynthesis
MSRGYQKIVLSVLLPYRDAAATICQAIASVLAEPEVDELVAIDDGSADDGPARVARIIDPRLVTLASRGVGIARALALGLARAKGDLVARMDADDLSLPGRFSKQRALLASEPGLAAAGARVRVDEDAGHGLRAYVAWQNALVTREDHARAIFVESPLCHPSVTLRRSALEAAGGWREVAWPEDWDLWLRLDALGFGLAKVPEVLLEWRSRPGRATFNDPRCAPPRLLEARAHYLAPRLRGPVWIWGAGKTGRRVARALEPHGVRAQAFVDIDPRKIGKRARGAPIFAPDALARGACTVVVAVGDRGARDVVRARLAARGFAEGTDFICAS